MPTDLDTGPWRSERVIKLEIASLFCDNLGDVMTKIKKKLSPFMPMTFMNVYFNEHPIVDPEGTLLSSLVPSDQHNSCLFASIGMSCIGDEGTRNAIVHIEDPKFHASRSKNNSSSKPQSQSGLVLAKSLPSTESGNAPCTVQEDALPQPPALMPGGIFNMVPDVLEEPSTSTSAAGRRNNYQRPPRAPKTSEEGVVVQVQSGKTSVIRHLERPPAGGVSWKVAQRGPGQLAPKAASLTRILGLNAQRRHVVVPSNNLTVYAKKAAAQRNWGLNAGANADRLKQNIQDGILLDSQTWMEDGHFQTMMEMNDIPRDPEQWNETHVQIWIRWASKHFGFNKQRSEVLQKVHGRNLVCDLIAAQILKMVECPPEVSRTFLSHLKLLKEKRIVAVPQDPSNTLASGSTTAPCYRLIQGGTSLGSSRLVAAPVSVSNGTSGSGRMRGYCRGHLAPLLTSSNAAPVLSTLQQPFSAGGATSSGQSGAGGGGGGTGRRQLPNLSESSMAASSGGPGQSGGQPQLWQFLLDLLTDWKYYNDIQWNTDDGEFKLLNPERVAKAWGERKNKPTMNYEKLSRALRYYYDGDMLAKVQGKKFVYKFVCNLKHLLGYEAKHLRQLVEACAMRHRDELERSRVALLYPNAPVPVHQSGRNLRSEPADCGAASTVPLEAPARFHPYNVPRLGPTTALPPQTALQMRRRQRLQVQRSVNPTLFTAEANATADASPFLPAQMPADRWRSRGGEIWPPGEELQGAADDERCVEEGEVTPEVEGDEIKMPSLLMGPSVSAGGPGSNCANSTAAISPLKLLGASSADTVMNAAAVDAELGQYLSGEFQNNGEAVSVDVTDDIELDHFLSFEDKCLPTSPNRQIYSNSTRLVAANRNGANNVLGVASSSVNSLTSNGIGAASSNGHGACISFSNSSGSVCISNENGLTSNASTSNSNRVHQVLVATGPMSDPEGDAMLHPFLDTSSSDTINIHSDTFEPWS